MHFLFEHEGRASCKANNYKDHHSLEVQTLNASAGSTEQKDFLGVLPKSMNNGGAPQAVP